MLYIKFDIQDSSKYTDFQKVYDHMLQTRQPNFKFEEDEGPDFDWDRMTEDEIQEATKQLIEFLDQDPEALRYNKLIPNYANAFIEQYLQGGNDTLIALEDINTLSILNYLEFGFEVEMDNLEKINERCGIVEFSSGNFPFGGLERFLMTLKAFDLIPTECFDGFTVFKFEWTSNFEHNAIDLPEKTQEYLTRKGL
jgi:hypothetical protein